MKIVTRSRFRGQCREPFWSPGFGSVVDRFGIPRMINVISPADWKPKQG